MGGVFLKQNKQQGGGKFRGDGSKGEEVFDKCVPYPLSSKHRRKSGMGEPVRLVGREALREQKIIFKKRQYF